MLTILKNEDSNEIKTINRKYTYDKGIDKKILLNEI